MKKIIQLLSLVIIIAFACSGCKKEKNGNKYTSIELQVNEFSFIQGSGEAFEFTVLGSSDGKKMAITHEDKTSIFVDGIPVTNARFTPTAIGEYKVVATHEGLSSDTITLYSTGNTRIYKHRVLIEDFTGTWCGYCPRVLYAIELLNQQTDDVLIAAIHRGSTDPWNLASAAPLESALRVTGYPSVFINRSTSWTYPEPDNISQPIDMIESSGTPYGIAIETSAETGTFGLKLSIAFASALKDPKYVVYLLQDGLKFNQQNYYTNIFGGAATLTDFEHKDIVKEVLTNSILGDPIPQEEAMNGSLFEKEIRLTPFTTNNHRIMVILLNSSNKVVNVKTVNLGEDIGFESLVIP